MDIHDFISVDPVLGNMLLRHSEALLPLLEDAIVGAQREILARWSEFQKLAEAMMVEINSRRTRSGKKRKRKRRILPSSSFGGDDDHTNRDQSGIDGENENGDDEHDDIVDNDPDVPIDIMEQPPMISSLDPEVKGEGNTRVHARLVHLPPHSSNCKPSLASLTSNDVGKILQLSGTVVKTSKVQMVEYERAYMCCEKKGCGERFSMKADLLQWNNALPVPSR